MDLLPGLKTGAPLGATAPYRVVARYMWSIWDSENTVLPNAYIDDAAALSALVSANQSERKRLVLIWNEARICPNSRFTWRRQGPVFVLPLLSGREIDLQEKKPALAFICRFSSMAGGTLNQYLKVHASVFLALREDHKILLPT